MKSLTLGIIISLISLAVTFVIIEIGFRLIADKKSSKWSDRPTSYFIHQDSQTFQDYPHLEHKPDNTFRIAVIGDSFTFAPYMQFDDAFPKRLERYLNLNSNQKKVEVINYGVPAYSTSHEVKVVEKAIKEGADYILMEVTLNDPEIKPYTPTQLSKDKNKFGELELTNPIFQYWKSLAFVLKRLHNTQTYNNYIQKFFDLFNKPKTWNNFSDSFRSIVKLSFDSNVPIGAVVFPLFGIPLSTEYPFHPIHKKVATLLTELSVPYFDLYSTFEEIPLDRMQVIVGQDFHPNEICHRLAAEAILKWWKDSLQPPSAFYPLKSYSERTGIILPGQPLEPQILPSNANQITDEGDFMSEN